MNSFPLSMQCRWETWVRFLGGKIPWRRDWQHTPVFLPGESHGQRSLGGYGPWGDKESDRTERLGKEQHTQCKNKGQEEGMRRRGKRKKTMDTSSIRYQITSPKTTFWPLRRSLVIDLQHIKYPTTVQIINIPQRHSL